MSVNSSAAALAAFLNPSGFCVVSKDGSVVQVSLPTNDAQSVKAVFLPDSGVLQLTWAKPDSSAEEENRFLFLSKAVGNSLEELHVKFRPGVNHTTDCTIHVPAGGRGGLLRMLNSACREAWPDYVGGEGIAAAAGSSGGLLQLRCRACGLGVLRESGRHGNTEYKGMYLRLLHGSKLVTVPLPSSMWGMDDLRACEECDTGCGRKYWEKEEEEKKGSQGGVIGEEEEKEKGSQEGGIGGDEGVVDDSVGGKSNGGRAAVNESEKIHGRSNVSVCEEGEDKGVGERCERGTKNENCQKHEHHSHGHLRVDNRQWSPEGRVYVGVPDVVVCLEDLKPTFRSTEELLPSQAVICPHCDAPLGEYLSTFNLFSRCGRPLNSPGKEIRAAQLRKAALSASPKDILASRNVISEVAVRIAEVVEEKNRLLMRVLSDSGDNLFSPVEVRLGKSLLMRINIPYLYAVTSLPTHIPLKLPALRLTDTLRSLHAPHCYTCMSVWWSDLLPTAGGTDVSTPQACGADFCVGERGPQVEVGASDLGMPCVGLSESEEAQLRAFLSRQKAVFVQPSQRVQQKLNDKFGVGEAASEWFAAYVPYPSFLDEDAIL